MEKGSYKSKKIDFSKFTISTFPIYLRSKTYAHYYGCGATAISALSKDHSPEYFARLNKFRNHYDDRFMIKYLKKEGYTVVPITIASLTNTEMAYNPLTSKHLLLVSQMMLKNEGTWTIVINSEYLLHNMELSLLNPLEFANHPILSLYILFKKSLQ